MADANGTDRKVKVLVVEDEALVSLMICRELNKVGFDAVNKAATAEDAIRSAEELQPDFIFMDIRLIGAKDGIDAAESIRAARGSGLPIAFMTAYDSAEIKDRAMRVAPAAYLEKPVNVRSLKELIDRETRRAG